MDYTILIQRLMNGDNYTATNAEGEQYTVQNPPNSLMINAGKVIQQLVGIINQNNQIIGNLQYQIQKLSEENETFRQSKPTPEVSTTDA